MKLEKGLNVIMHVGNINEDEKSINENTEIKNNDIDDFSKYMNPPINEDE